mmetsp:Transcript_17700/g.57254  ORF Transcript_17700/g.57254 Transcript_17700/m.57254 type:complete len:142 (+) Transcript_17700:328-753(+)
MLAPSSCSRRPHGIHRVAPVAGDPPDCMYIRVDQVWEDVRKEEGVTDGKTFGPLGTTTKGQLDEDIPGYGKFYCIACSKYFIDDFTLTQHNRSKPHKRRVKELKGVRPHNAEDAEQAGGLGPTDNGPRLRSAGAVAVEMAF